MLCRALGAPSLRIFDLSANLEMKQEHLVYRMKERVDLIDQAECKERGENELDESLYHRILPPNPIHQRHLSVRQHAENCLAWIQRRNRVGARAGAAWTMALRCLTR